MSKSKKSYRNRGYQVIKFATNEEWKESRRQGIGSSEVGAILGLSPFATPWDVWAQKLGLVEPVKETFVMEMGHAMEPWIASKFSEATGIKVIESSEGDWVAVDNEHPYLRVSPDRTYWIPGLKHNAENKGIAECKSSYSAHSESALYEECKYWFCQLQYQLHVMRYTEGYLCFMCVDRNQNGQRWFQRVQYNPEFCNEFMVPMLQHFWEAHILPARQFLQAHQITDPLHMSPEYWEAINEFAPPVASADDVTHRYRHQTDGKTVSASDDVFTGEISVDGITSFSEMITTLRSVNDQLKSLESKKKSIEDFIKIYMKDAETLTSTDGHVIATFRQNKASSKFNSKGLQSKYPDIYQEFLETTPGARVLRFSK